MCIFIQKHFASASSYEIFQKTNCSIAERSFSLGTLAESVEALGTVSGQFVPQLLPLFQQGACDEDDEVRSNAIYGLGVLGQHGKFFPGWVFQSFIFLLSYPYLFIYLLSCDSSLNHLCSLFYLSIVLYLMHFLFFHTYVLVFSIIVNKKILQNPFVQSLVLLFSLFK